MPVSFNQRFRKHFPGLSRLATRLEYDLLSAVDKRAEFTFLNYGYAALDDPPLPVDTESPYQARMYQHLASSVDWAGKTVLEVGCGRGGGAHYLAQTFHPAVYTALDLSPRAIAFCRRRYTLPVLTFETGNAENLRFPDGSFDIVLNVESSLYYPHPEIFLAEVTRVLRPGGHFLYADLRYAEELTHWQAQRARMPLMLCREENLTSQVRLALELDQARKQALIRQLIPSPFRIFFEDFSGMHQHAGLAADPAAPRPRERVYLMFVYRKD